MLSLWLKAEWIRASDSDSYNLRIIEIGSYWQFLILFWQFISAVILIAQQLRLVEPVERRKENEHALHIQSRPIRGNPFYHWIDRV
jgi:hypothetical protein